MTDAFANDVARTYCVEDLASATTTAARLRNILDIVRAGGSPSALNLTYLQQQGLAALHQLATGQITYPAFQVAGKLEQDQRIRHVEAQRIVREEQDKAREAAWAAKVESDLRQSELARQARERDPRHIAKVKNQQLRAKYGLDDFIEQHYFDRIMAVLRTADAGARFRAEDVIWLETEAKSYFSAQLRLAFHAAEADFCIEEYQRTRDPWHAVSASSHCRKSDRAEQAHELLASIPVDRKMPPKLRSAICTTHGGALRDLGQFDEAIALGEEAHALTPRDFRPCTLLGAVHMELGSYDAAQAWYKKAVELGADVRSIDSDIRGVVMRADKPKRQQLKQYLLREDPVRFAWVNKF